MFPLRMRAVAVATCLIIFLSSQGLEVLFMLTYFLASTNNCGGGTIGTFLCEKKRYDAPHIARYCPFEC